MNTIHPNAIKLNNGIIGGVQQLIALPMGIGSFLMGGLYSTTVVAGVHHMYTVIDVGQLGLYGVTYYHAHHKNCNNNRNHMALVAHQIHFIKSEPNLLCPQRCGTAWTLRRYLLAASGVCGQYRPGCGYFGSCLKNKKSENKVSCP